jgi:hypothetical protein
MKTWQISVYRIREQGDDDTPEGWDRHRTRSAAVKAALRDAPEWKEQSWGTGLDDKKRTHEMAQFVIDWVGQVAQNPLVHDAIQQGLAIAGDAIKDLVKDGLVHAVECIGSAMVGSLITRFIPSVQSKKVDTVYAQNVAPGGQVINVSIQRDPTKEKGVNLSINVSQPL